MKKLFSLMMVAALTLGLSACGKTADDNPDIVTEIPAGTEITFWHAMGGKNGEAVTALVEKFNAENEYGITVIEEFQGGYGDTDKKIMAALSAGEYPNIGQQYGNNIIRYVDSGVVVSLDDYINHSVWGIENFEDIVEAYRVENSAYPSGNFYSLPFSKSTEILYVNHDILEEVGVEVPTTLEELKTVSKAIYEATGKPGFGYDSLSNLFITWVQQYGSGYTNNDGEVLFNTPEAVEAVEFFAEGVAEGYFRIAGEDRYLSGPFNNGDVAMFIGSTSGAGFVGAEGMNWKGHMVPFGDNKVVVQQGANFFMMDNTPEENAASFVFMRWLIEEDQTVFWALNSGYLPVRESARQNQVWLDFVNGGSPVASTKIAGMESAPYYSFDPIFAESYDLRKAAQAIVEDVLNGITTAEEAIANAAK